MYDYAPVRSDDPVAPLQIFEAHVHLFDLTAPMMVIWARFNQRIHHVRLLATTHSRSFRSTLVLHRLHEVLSFEIPNHEWLVFVFASRIHQADFIQLYLMVRTIHGICPNVNTSVVVWFHQPFGKCFGDIHLEPAMIIRCSICARDRGQLVFNLAETKIEEFRK